MNKITIISLSSVLAGLPLLALESPPPAAGNRFELFKRIDRNGDGKLTRDEIPQRFDQLDTITLTHAEIGKKAADRDHPLGQLVLRFLQGADATKLPARLDLQQVAAAEDAVKLAEVPLKPPVPPKSTVPDGFGAGEVGEVRAQGAAGPAAAS